jgi:hypothetical protein
MPSSNAADLGSTGLCGAAQQVEQGNVCCIWASCCCVLAVRGGSLIAVTAVAACLPVFGIQLTCDS